MTISPSAKTDDGATFGGGFGDGKLGMVGSGAFQVGSLKKDHPDLDFGVTALPGKDGGSSSFAGGCWATYKQPSGPSLTSTGRNHGSWLVRKSSTIADTARSTPAAAG